MLNLLLGLVAPHQSDAFGPGKVETFVVDGVSRQARVVEGKLAKAGQPTPLVFAFHGHSGNMNHSARFFDVQGTWPDALVVYPQGLPTPGMTDPEGKLNGWQQRIGDQGGRDLKFFDKMLAQLKREYRIDDRRIYTMGHSNGGRFSYLLWATHPDVFAAYGISGSPATGLLRNLQPASAFLIAGEKDPIVSFAMENLSIQALKRLDGVDPKTAKNSGYTEYTTAANGLEIGTYIHPGGHEYPVEAARLTVQFFIRKQRE